MRTRAARLYRHGEPLRVEELELPEPGPDEVLVQMRFAGVNPIDRYIAAGSVAGDAPLPRTLGGEGAGSLDDRPVLVAGGGLGSQRDGLWAGAAVVPRSSVLPLPDGVEPREAAAMGVAGLTAWNTVHELARVGPEDRVLVLGASGGVGSMIIGLARAAGATVWAQSSSEEKREFIKSLGAQRVIVGAAGEIAGQLRELEPTVILDPLGGDFVAAGLEAMSPRGRYVSYGTSAGAELQMNMQVLYRKMISLLGYGGMQIGIEERRQGLGRALDALREGSLRVRIDDLLDLEQADEAFRRLAERRVQGKLLLKLDG